MSSRVGPDYAGSRVKPVGAGVSADELKQGRETWAQLARWTCCCLVRGDGTPIGTRALDLITRAVFYYAGMSHGSPTEFKRKSWDRIVSSRAFVPPARDDRGVRSHDETVPPAAVGEPAVPVRVYAPAASDTQAAVDAEVVLFFVHGGGQVIGSECAVEAHQLVTELVRRLGCHAYSVGYRLAPEHGFPCGLRDTVNTLAWLHTSGRHPRARFVLSGDSAGGNLALVSALLVARGLDADLREHHAMSRLQPRIGVLALLYPALYEIHTHSQRSPQLRYLLSAGSRAFFLQAYLGQDEAQQAALLGDFRVCPLRASWLDKLPPTTVVSAHLDPLHDENCELVHALRRSGVPVIHIDEEAVPHGFVTLPAWASDADKVERTLDRLAKAIRASLVA